MNQFQELQQKYAEVVTSARVLYEENVDQPLWRNKLKYIDSIALFPTENFSHCEQQVLHDINEILSQHPMDLFETYFNLRLAELDEELEFLSLGTIATTCNVLREFNHDTLRDLNRITSAKR